jgi:hypothetical protein
MKSKREINRLLMDNIETETLKRKWIRRYYISLTEEHRQKCLYFIKLYGGSEGES